MEKFDVSLILPCYNELQTFNNSIRRIIDVLDGTDYTWEIIFIDDSSSDGTRELIKKAIKKYSRRTLRTFFHQKNQGRGRTVVDGIINAQGRIVGFIDIDLEVGEWYLPKFIQEIEKGADVAIAWRVYDFNLKTLLRWFSSKGYSFLRKVILKLPYEDTEAGYKFFRKRTILPVIEKCRFSGWFWDTEIMAMVHKHKLKVKEIPVAFVRRLDKTSTVRLLPDTIKYIINLLNFRIKN